MRGYCRKCDFICIVSGANGFNCPDCGTKLTREKIDVAVELRLLRKRMEENVDAACVYIRVIAKAVAYKPELVDVYRQNVIEYLDQIVEDRKKLNEHYQR